MTPSLILIGLLTSVCWWKVRALGDIRLHLAAFYGWFALAFCGYLTALWLIHQLSARAIPRRTTGWLLGIVAIGAVIFRMILLPTVPTLSDDVYRYRWDGLVQQAGIDPYAYPPNAPELAFLRDEQFSRINFPHLRTVYPPATQLAFRAGAVIGETVTAQKLVFVLSEALIGLCLIAVLRARRMHPLWVVAYAWHPLAILEVAGSGHNDVVGLVALWAGLAAWQHRRPAGAAVGWAVALLAKYATVILVPWWLFRRSARRWLLVFGLLSALPLIASPAIMLALFESLSTMTTRFESNASVYVLLAALVGHAGIARALVIGAWVVFLLWWAWREEDPARYLCGGLAAAALLSPVLHPWYLLWLLPFLCLWRIPVLLALSGVVVLAYAVWPGYLSGGAWVVPVWARVGEYVVVAVVALWSVRRWWWELFFRLATKRPLLAKS